MTHPRLPSRRSFLRRSASLGVLAAAAPSALRSATVPPAGPEFSLFTKHLLGMEAEALAGHAASLGFAGIEAPVRPGGHVLPERVEEDLPKFVETLRKSGLKLSILTTGISEVSAAQHTEKVLRTAASLGIKFFRLNWWRYDLKKPLPPQLEEIGAKARDLVALARELGIRPLSQNHNGPDYVGSVIWDLESVMRGHRPEDWGFAYDLMHAGIVGGTSWPISYHLARPRIGAVYFKDFRWAGRLKPEPCPLGEGMADGPALAKVLRESGFSGPVVLHVEYLKATRIANAEEVRLAHEAALRDFGTLRRWWGV